MDTFPIDRRKNNVPQARNANSMREILIDPSQESYDSWAVVLIDVMDV